MSGITVFNSSRAASGLAAGQPIDTALIGQIKDAPIMIWLVSPTSARKSFWMAWELGVADASEKAVFPCRTLGVTAEQLPLLQNRRHVPDLGIRDDLSSFLDNLAGELKIEGSTVAEAVNEFYEAYPVTTPFDASEADNVVVTLAGSRLIVENTDHASVRDLLFHVSGQNVSVGRPPLPGEVVRVLRKSLSSVSHLDAMERKLVSVYFEADDAETLLNTAIAGRWIDEVGERRIQNFGLRLHT